MKKIITPWYPVIVQYSVVYHESHHFLQNPKKTVNTTITADAWTKVHIDLAHDVLYFMIMTCSYVR